MSQVRELGQDAFAEATAKGVVLVDFWAPWCGPCKMLLPILDQVADELAGEALVCKVNVDESKELAAQFAVRKIPALFVLKDGEIVNQFVGVQTKAKLLDAVRNA